MSYKNPDKLKKNKKKVVKENPITPSTAKKASVKKPKK